MAGAASVLEDGSLLSRLDRGLNRVERVMALVSGLAVFGLMVLAVISVTGRNLFNEPLPGYVDWIEAAMPLIAFMGIAYVQQAGGHIRMDIVVGQLSGRLLWFFELITTALILVLIVALIWGSWAHFDRSFDLNAPMWSRDSSIDIGLPIWPAKLIIFIGFVILMGRLIISFFGYIQMLRNPQGPVYAVPQRHDIEEIVAQEAEAARDAITDQDVEEELERESRIGSGRNGERQ